MTLRVGADAPNWGQQLAKAIDMAFDQQVWPFISKTKYTRAQLNATLAAQYPWKLAIVSDGASNRFVAISNGSAFYYLDGSAV